MLAQLVNTDKCSVSRGVPNDVDVTVVQYTKTLWLLSEIIYSVDHDKLESKPSLLMGYLEFIPKIIASG